METTETTTETREFGRAAREGLKGLFKAQTIFLDFANEQNAVAFKAVRERMIRRAIAFAHALLAGVGLAAGHVAQPDGGTPVAVTLHEGTSMAAALKWPVCSAFTSAEVSMRSPRARFTTIAPAFICGMDSAFNIRRVWAVDGQCNVRMSD